MGTCPGSRLSLAPEIKPWTYEQIRYRSACRGFCMLLPRFAGRRAVGDLDYYNCDLYDLIARDFELAFQRACPFGDSHGRACLQQCRLLKQVIVVPRMAEAPWLTDALKLKLFSRSAARAGCKWCHRFTGQAECMCVVRGKRSGSFAGALRLRLAAAQGVLLHACSAGTRYRMGVYINSHMPLLLHLEERVPGADWSDAALAPHIGHCTQDPLTSVAQPFESEALLPAIFADTSYPAGTAWNANLLQPSTGFSTSGMHARCVEQTEFDRLLEQWFEQNRDVFHFGAQSEIGTETPLSRASEAAALFLRTSALKSVRAEILSSLSPDEAARHAASGIPQSVLPRSCTGGKDNGLNTMRILREIACGVARLKFGEATPATFERVKRQYVLGLDECFGATLAACVYPRWRMHLSELPDKIPPFADRFFLDASSAAWDHDDPEFDIRHPETLPMPYSVIAAIWYEPHFTACCFAVHPSHKKIPKMAIIRKMQICPAGVLYVWRSVAGMLLGKHPLLPQPSAPLRRWVVQNMIRVPPCTWRRRILWLADNYMLVILAVHFDIMASALSNGAVARYLRHLVDVQQICASLVEMIEQVQRDLAAFLANTTQLRLHVCAAHLERKMRAFVPTQNKQVPLRLLEMLNQYVLIRDCMHSSNAGECIMKHSPTEFVLLDNRDCTSERLVSARFKREVSSRLERIWVMLHNNETPFMYKLISEISRSSHLTPNARALIINDTCTDRVGRVFTEMRAAVRRVLRTTDHSLHSMSFNALSSYVSVDTMQTLSRALHRYNTFCTHGIGQKMLATISRRDQMFLYAFLVEVLHTTFTCVRPLSTWVLRQQMQIALQTNPFSRRFVMMETLCMQWCCWCKKIKVYVETPVLKDAMRRTEHLCSLLSKRPISFTKGAKFKRKINFARRQRKTVGFVRTSVCKADGAFKPCCFTKIKNTASNRGVHAQKALAVRCNSTPHEVGMVLMAGMVFVDRQQRCAYVRCFMCERIILWAPEAFYGPGALCRVCISRVRSWIENPVVLRTCILDADRVIPEINLTFCYICSRGYTDLPPPVPQFDIKQRWIQPPDDDSIKPTYRNALFNTTRMHRLWICEEDGGPIRRVYVCAASHVKILKRVDTTRVVRRSELIKI